MAPKEDFQIYLENVEELAANVVRNAPPESMAVESYRADLAGFLSIAYAAAFEECIKDIIKSFARRHHVILHRVIERNFDRINGRIKIDIIKSEYLTCSPELTSVES